MHFAGDLGQFSLFYLLFTSQWMLNIILIHYAYKLFTILLLVVDSHLGCLKDLLDILLIKLLTFINKIEVFHLPMKVNLVGLTFNGVMEPLYVVI